MGQFFGDFSCSDDIVNEFNITDQDLEGVRILIADYNFEGYEGSAFVLFEKDGSYYEVHGDHCSCYGLEGQWEPEKTYLYALRYRLRKGHFYASAGVVEALEDIVGIE